MTQIWLKRAYEAPAPSDGQRILVDRLWPRGVSKEELHLDDWMKEIAPSDALRDWFGHDPAKWKEFQTRYAKELDKNGDAVAPLKQRLDKGRVTLVFAAKDEAHNNAVALKAYLEGN
ncbi:MAG: DUF488 domain-containing protein [Paracoccus sp. (in: a-proteobacteria)]|jgi:uncharacterized protein YeaO (DUF488 family)|uniref:DUF488 domain-containing protein n=1 Tax=Paracoccus maritimus TaxID=2933292 RepID=A0ABT2KER0_9RHOB|nr:DUF488 domain-containing protein [Paracoccus sp. YLB-12]MAM36929.1 hypothetical protein [Erythrobacter sp.]MAM39869.1 hypothetical protein [Erythrobacter sp.]MCT4334340.1 DUF488 domain-containing protein [Paracoccus sp. YLB-12]|tara:strand:- start:628 stop:978 length:351 start_codon:yes stop_codon:yes gene_type:complete